ncbi:MAG: non-heme Fe2+,alpha-ketoglutarate-dependent halogenase [Phenylobacterium sp.]|jgi:non-heme Fe2+,alpha-ketoglutarate-dependent halogenase
MVTNPLENSIGDTTEKHIISTAQLAHYHQLGYVDSVGVLTAAEVDYFRHQFDQTCALLGGNVIRMDGAHELLHWVWQLSTHPALLGSMEKLLGPDIILKSTRFFYKPANSANFVSWHQDGYIERKNGLAVPTVWLGLTDSTPDNGCLQVIEASHHRGYVAHPKMPNKANMTYDGITAQIDNGKVANIAMAAGFMSLHHPLTVHGSQPNVSSGPRIGFSASYGTPELVTSSTDVAWVRGAKNAPEIAPESKGLVFIEPPKPCPLPEAVAQYQRLCPDRILRL